MPSVQSITPSSPTVAIPGRAKRATWYRAPQRLWLRRALFQIHLWMGIAVTLYAVVIGLSGSVLVFKSELEHVLYGKQIAVQSTRKEVSLTQAVARIQADRPGWVATGLRDFRSPDQAATLLMLPVASDKSADLKLVYFAPNTGRILAERMRYEGPLGWLTNLHYFLLLGRKGLLASGWMALALLMLSLTGVVLWWPGITRWKAALMLRRRASWKRVNWDLHAVVGFWSCAALIAVSFTGVYFAFPIPTAGAIVIATRGSIREALTYVSLPKVPPASAGTPLLSIDEALAAIDKVNPREAAISYLQIPQRPSEVYASVGYYAGHVPYSQLRRVAIDPHTGAVLRIIDTHSMPLGLRIVQYFHTVHFGSFGGEGVLGVLVKVVWSLMGLTPALLAATGLLMYWNRKLAPAWRRLRQ